MKIAAFDLATLTGVAVGAADGSPTFWSVGLSSAGQIHGARFSQCVQMARRIIREHEPDLIVLEKAVAGSTGRETNPQVLMGLRACVMVAAYWANIPVKEYAVSTIRSHFIGTAKLRRKPAKAAVMARCRDLGWNVEDDNQGDACALWDTARAKEGFQTPVGGLFNSG